MTNSNFSISAYNSYSLALYELAEESKILDQTYKKYLNNNEKIDIQKFLTFNYHIMTIKSFFYIPELVGLIHLPIWGFIGLREELDIKRVRNKEPKYVIQEAFNILYKDDKLPITEKIPFTRPTDIYMKNYFNDYEYIP